jgi:effector-binding domain-containing protein
MKTYEVNIKVTCHPTKEVTHIIHKFKDNKNQKNLMKLITELSAGYQLPNFTWEFTSKPYLIK